MYILGLRGGFIVVCSINAFSLIQIMLQLNPFPTEMLIVNQSQWHYIASVHEWLAYAAVPVQALEGSSTGH